MHQIGLETTIYDILIVVESGSRGGRIKPDGIFESRKFGDVFANGATTSGAMAK